MAEGLGLLGLFLWSFLAATIFPLTSEAALAASLASGMDKTLALTAASAGNVLGIMLNFGVGYWLYAKTHTRLERSKNGRKALEWGHEHGYWALLLSWLPVIGDPITLVAGLVRLNFFGFLLIAASLRIIRYWVITQAF
jgi:membrane protein YqaA with SNARE-associated domain